METALAVGARLPVSHALTEEMRIQLRKRMLRDFNMPEESAGQAVAGMEEFLQQCADDPKAKLSPSALVDKAWHAFILHTREYARFCQRVAGHFIHHNPGLVTDIGSVDCDADDCTATDCYQDDDD